MSHVCNNDCQRIIREQYDGGQRVFWNQFPYTFQSAWLEEKHSAATVEVVETLRQSPGWFRRTLNWFRKRGFWPGSPVDKQVRKLMPKLSKEVCPRCGQVRD